MPSDVAAFAVMYLLSGYGVTVGFHRMLTHRSFQSSKTLEYTFAVLGTMALILSAGLSEELSLEQQHQQEVAELNAA